MANPLKVYPNPWGISPLSLTGGGQSDHALDKYGNPCCTLATEPDGTPYMRYVGARVCAGRTVVLDGDRAKSAGTLNPAQNDYSLSSPPQKTVWEFLGVPADEPDFCAKFSTQKPVEVPANHYYLHELRAGMLLPGDGYTAKLAGYRFLPSQFGQLEAYARKLASWEDPTEPPLAGVAPVEPTKTNPTPKRAANQEGS
jgi:hypothetical protein